MSELRLVSQLVKLVEQTAKQKALIDFQLAMLNKEKDTLQQKMSTFIKSITYIDEDFDESSLRLEFDGSRLVKRKQFHRNVQDLVADVMKAEGLWLSLDEITMEVVKLDEGLHYTKVKITREQKCSVANVLRRLYRQGLIERTGSDLLSDKRGIFAVSRWRLKVLEQG